MDFNTILEKDRHLCRYPLLMDDSAPDCSLGDTAADMVWFPVNGIQAFWKNMSLSAHLEIFRHLAAALGEPRGRFSFAVYGDGGGLHFYYGCLREKAPALQAVLKGLLSGVDLGNMVTMSAVLPDGRDWMGGVMVGQPGEIEEAPGQGTYFKLPVDVLSGSMLGSRFVLQVMAERIPTPVMLEIHSAVRLEDQRISPLLVKNVVERNQRQENRIVEDYSHHLRMASADLEAGIQEGGWSTCVFFAAAEEADCERIESLLKSAWMGRRDRVYQPLHCMALCGRGCESGAPDVLECMKNGCLPGALMGCCGGENVLDSVNGRPFNGYQMRTALTTSQLSRLCQLPRYEYPGYYVDAYVEFDTARRQLPHHGDTIALGNVVRVDQARERPKLQNPYLLATDDLTRHLLVVGITGGGKSNTTKSILATLWGEKRRPFLVIESAKREYHTLLNLTREDGAGNQAPVFQRIHLFTMGDENPRTGLPYRLNPFEVMPGASIQTHIDYLLCAFKAAFELYPPMPYVLETMVYEVYSDLGWDVVTNANRYGLTIWPTLTGLYNKIDEVTDRLGYYEEVKNNVKAALRARINSLRIGGKGAMLDVPASIPLRTLLDQPTVLELEDLGDDDSKAFVIGILMVQLYEYRKTCPPSPRLEHLLVMEEAHRLLKKVPSGGEGSQSRAKSVEFFCNMISEIRSYGQGIMICDQVPTRLADDALKNTNCKIVHRTVMQEDRQAIGCAMHMSEEQMDFLSSLPRGCAAVFSEGDNRPKLVRFPLMQERGARTREEIVESCRTELCAAYGEVYRAIPRYCRSCQLCARQDHCIRELLARKGMLQTEAVADVWKEFDRTLRGVSGENLEILVDRVDAHCNTELDRAGKLCLAGMLLDRSPLREGERARALGAYYALTQGKDNKRRIMV